MLRSLERIQSDFNGSQPGGKKVSLADLIVLGGGRGGRAGGRSAGHDVRVPFSPGRTDASPGADRRRTRSSVLEPTADGFRNYFRSGDKRRPEELLVDRASLLGLTAPEMTALVGGLRVLGVQRGSRPGTASSPADPDR